MEICGPVSEVEVPGFLVNPGIRQVNGIRHSELCQRFEQDRSRVADQRHVTGAEAGGGHRHSVEEVRATIHDATSDGQVPAGSNRSKAMGSSYPDDEFGNYGIDEVCGGPVAVQPGSQDNWRERGANSPSSWQPIRAWPRLSFTKLAEFTHSRRLIPCSKL